MSENTKKSESAETTTATSKGADAARKAAAMAGPTAKKALGMGLAIVRKSNEIGAKILDIADTAYSRGREASRAALQRSQVVSRMTDVLFAFALYAIGLETFRVVVSGSHSIADAMVSTAPLLVAAVAEGGRRVRRSRKGG